ncbi:unnamed protein product [Lactuca saligna]|uniref:Uncharacterized protein n=1 Tax=Lactuca saligna TaxID=75948 RepID=A0AA36E498_LACSI|nr:unnamed protein product [Lactuca saligna]
MKTANAPYTYSGADHMIFSFSLKHMKPQYEAWSLSKITGVKVTGPLETNSFPNAKLKVARGSTNQVYEFTLADLPCLNPNDWFVLYNMLLKEKDKYEPAMSHLQIMIKSYIQEIGNMDVEVAAVLQKKPTVVLKESPKDLEKIKLGKIYSKEWYVVYQSRDRTEADYYSRETARMTSKCFSHMILWYLEVRQTVLGIIPKVDEVQKRIQG